MENKIYQVTKLKDYTKHIWVG